MTKWLDVAKGYEGQAEVAGPGSNVVILSWINAHGRPDAGDDSTIAWCGFAMAAWFTEAGHAGAVPREPGAARNWRGVGEPLTVPEPGCIVVIPRRDPANPEAAHVGLVAGFDATHLLVLAGNQGNRVSIETFERDDRWCVYRWPLKRATPAQVAAEGSRIAAAARRQQRDGLVSGGAMGSTQLPAAPPPPTPHSPLPTPKTGVREAVDGALTDVTWFKTSAAKIVDFATFVSMRWQWVALGVAVYFGLRCAWDSGMIARWRTQDRNEGYTT